MSISTTKALDSGWVEDEEESDPVSRSCLAFRFGKNKKHPFQHVRAPSSREVPKRPAYLSTTDIAASQHNNVVPIITPHSKSAPSISVSLGAPLDHLMTPPMPENRRQRAAYESQKRQKGLYEGEIEPEGQRGQEMPFPVSATISPDTSTDSLPIRTFHSKERPSYGPGQSIQMFLPDKPSFVEAVLKPVVVEQRVQQSCPGGKPESVKSSSRPRNDAKAVKLVDASRYHMNSAQGRPMSPDALLGRPPQFAPSLQASKASSPGSNNVVKDDDDNSSTSSSSLKKLQEDFLNDMEIPSDEDENDESPMRNRVTRRAFPSTPTTPTTAATSTYSVASSNANGTAATIGTNATNTSAERNVHALHAVAMEHVHNGDLESAVSILETVITLQTRIHGKVSPQVASAHHNLGTVHAKRAQLLTDGTVAQAHVRATALQCFQTAARTARDSLGRCHGNVAVSLVRMGFLLLQARHYQNAVIVFQEALRIRLSVYGSRHLLVANLYNNLGVCHMHMGNFEKGKEYLIAALDIQREMTTESIHQLELADTLFNIGGLCLEWIRRQGPDVRRAVEAEGAFAEAYEIRKRILGQSDPMTLQVKALLDMSRAVPRPRLGTSTKKGTRSKDVMTPEEAMLSNGNMQLPTRTQRDPTTWPDEQRSQSTDGAIFRQQVNRGLQMTPAKFDSRSQVPKKERSPPMPQVSVSNDEVDAPRILMLPLYVPTSPQRRDRSDDAVNLTLESSLSPDLSLTDPRPKGFVPFQKALSYDAEESCLISETGVESDHGKIHYPLSWSKAGLEGSKDSGSASRNSRDILVTRPFRQRRGDHQGLQTESTASSDNWGSETVNFSTGNKDRDDVMTRAKAVLDAHRELPELQDPHSPPRAGRRELERHFGDMDEDMDAEVVRSLADNLGQDDGVAPLGGDWPRDKNLNFSHEMTLDPMNHLHLIHDEATRLLHENNSMDALPLFEAVVECQRRRHGQLHPDVASALHNVGIALLREQNYPEALKSFGEAARIRKGALGRQHPQVAESLVKVGITLLLLQRFEDALWSFREALSVRKHAMGNLHPSTARIYNNIGCVHVEFQEYREARRAFEAALDVQRSALAQDPDNGPLMFATTTTLCNFGYLYRLRDMHSKATLVLKEAFNIQERVLGRFHSNVLSTLDNLADSCVNSGQAVDALRFYNMLYERFRAVKQASGTNVLRAEAMLLYKMSRVHRQRNDRESQLEKLKLALRAIRAYPETSEDGQIDTLERRIQYDIRTCREQLEKEELEWI